MALCYKRPRWFYEHDVCNCNRRMFSTSSTDLDSFRRISIRNHAYTFHTYCLFIIDSRALTLTYDFTQMHAHESHTCNLLKCQRESLVIHILDARLHAFHNWLVITYLLRDQQCVGSNKNKKKTRKQHGNKMNMDSSNNISFFQFSLSRFINSHAFFVFSQSHSLTFSLLHTHCGDEPKWSLSRTFIFFIFFGLERWRIWNHFKSSFLLLSRLSSLSLSNSLSFKMLFTRLPL